MKSAEMKSRERKCSDSASAFTFIELLVVIGVVFVISGMTIIQLQSYWQQAQSSAAMDQVKSTLRQARARSI